jgi:hypothetical protein
MRCSAAVGCAARLGGGLTASGCARWLGGLGLTATFVVGLALVKVERRRQQLEESVANYLAQLDTADLQEPSEALAAKTAHLKEKLAKLASEMQKLEAYEKQMLRPISKFRSLIPTVDRWPRAGAAQVSSATMCKM